MTCSLDTGRLDGERRRDAALDLLTVHREAIIRRGQRLFVERLLEHGSGTIDAVRASLEIPEGIDPRCCGAITASLARLGFIEADGFVVTSRGVAHARSVRLWRLTDGEAARRWLAYHPAPPDEPPPAVAVIVPSPSPKNEPGAAVPPTTPGMEHC